MQRDVAAGLRAGDGADEEPERPAAVRCRRVGDSSGLLASICWSDEPCGGADADRHVIALLEIGRRADVRDAVRPDQDPRAGAEREHLVLARADQRLQRGLFPVSTWTERLPAFGPGAGEHFAAERIELTVTVAGGGSTDESDAGERHSGESERETELHSDPPWFVRCIPCARPARGFRKG